MPEVPTTEPPAETALPAESANSCPRACPRHAARGALLAAAGWLAAAVAAVFVASIPYDPGESLCGVWGCLPPLPALVAMHLLWCVALGAVVWTVGRRFPTLLRPLGLVLLLAAFVASAGLVANDLIDWLHQMPAEYRQFWPQRIGYRVVTLTDVPLVQSLFVGAGCAIWGRSGR